MKQELKACPFCGGAVEDAFENLWDNDEGEIEKCWTVLHSCPVLKTNVWAHADSKAEAITAWNKRASDELVAAASLAIPDGFCVDNPNVPDSTIVPLDFTMGELRQIAAAIAKAKGGAA